MSVCLFISIWTSVNTQINHIQIGKRPRWYKKVPACFQHWWKSQTSCSIIFTPNQWKSLNHKNGSWCLVPDSDKWSSPFTYSAKTLQKAYLLIWSDTDAAKCRMFISQIRKHIWNYQCDSSCDTNKQYNNTYILNMNQFNADSTLPIKK